MKENLFEMGAKFQESWSSDNQDKPILENERETKEPQKHRLIFAKEKRRGKVVTLLRDFYRDTQELEMLLKELKQSLGVGGTLKGDTMEFQGEVQEKLRKMLSVKGYKFKN